MTNIQSRFLNTLFFFHSMFLKRPCVFKTHFLSEFPCIPTAAGREDWGCHWRGIRYVTTATYHPQYHHWLLHHGIHGLGRHGNHQTGMIFLYHLGTSLMPLSQSLLNIWCLYCVLPLSMPWKAINSIGKFLRFAQNPSSKASPPNLPLINPLSHHSHVIFWWIRYAN